MSSIALTLALCLCAVEPSDHDKQLDRAIARGLESLHTMQDARGCWRDRGNRPHPAVTALAVMAFLSAGHVPGEGRYGQTVEKGIRWTLSQQQANGLIAGNGQQEMYQHGIATLMLAEAAGMCDADTGKEVRQAVEKAVSVILRAQRTGGIHRGGWRYRAAGSDSDISVTGWQMMALRAARNLGCDVPAEAIDRGIDYVKRCQDPGTGGFRYTPYGGLTVACTGTSILALEIAGARHHRCEEATRGGAFLIRRQNLPQPRQPWFFYSIYYGSQAAFQLGGNYWEVYRPRLHDVLLKLQTNSGYFDGPSNDARQVGRAYCTAMSLLALTVEYRYLPIYQRGEEEDPSRKR